MKKLLLGIVAAMAMFSTAAHAQGNLAQTGWRCTPGGSAPAQFAVGACNGGVGPCIGLWCPSTGVYANTLVMRNADGTDTPATIPSLAANSGKVLSNDGTSLSWVAGGGGSGTVTSVTCNGGLSGGTFTTTGTCSINLGSSNVWTVGQTMALLNLTNLTNQFAIGGGGKITTLSFTQPVASFTLTFPDAGGADTATYNTLAATLANKTLTAPVINGATSSGSTALDFSANTGAFKTSTGAHTFGSASWAVPANTAITGGSSATNTTGLQLTSNVADGASSVALDINNATTLSTSTAMLLRLRNNGVNEVTFSERGDIVALNQITAANFATTADLRANLGIKNGGSGAFTQPGGSLQINFGTNGFESAITLTGNVTAVTLHATATPSSHLGTYMVLTFIQDATGSRTVTGWDSSFKWMPSTYLGTNHVAPTLTTAAAARDTFTFVSDGTNWVEVNRQLNN